jgi:hypothetical protein
MGLLLRLCWPMFITTIQRFECSDEIADVYLCALHRHEARHWVLWAPRSIRRPVENALVPLIVPSLYIARDKDRSHSLIMLLACLTFSSSRNGQAPNYTRAASSLSLNFYQAGVIEEGFCRNGSHESRRSRSLSWNRVQKWLFYLSMSEPKCASRKNKLCNRTEKVATNGNKYARAQTIKNHVLSHLRAEMCNGHIKMCTETNKCTTYLTKARTDITSKHVACGSSFASHNTVQRIHF